MAPAGDPSLTETPEYRIVILFVAFIAITLAFEKFLGWMNHYLKSHNRRGLLHTIHKLEEELLALGLISLLLIVLEEYVVKICVDSDDDGKAGKKLASSKTKEANGEKAPSDNLSDDTSAVLDQELNASPYSDDPLGTQAFEDEGVDADATLVDDLGGNRRLLSGMMRTLLAGKGGGPACPDGEESFWSIRTLHETHIFIFLLASVHIVFAGISMVLCSWKVRQWKQWEVSRHQSLKRIEYTQLLDTNNWFVHYVRAFFAQFHQHIDESVYLSLRRLFIERMELDHDFQFHEFLVNFMEEEFSKVIKLEWVMWLVAAIWIATNSAVVLIMTGVGIVVTLLAGTKLESIALKLGNEAYIMYADKPPRAPKKGNALTRRLSKISTGISQKLKGGSEGRANGEQPKKVFHSDGVDPSQIFDTANTDFGTKAQFAGGPWATSAAQYQPRSSAESGNGHDSVLSVGQGVGGVGGPVVNSSEFPAPPMRRGALNGYDPLYSRSMELQPAGGQAQGVMDVQTQPAGSAEAGASGSWWCCCDDSKHEEELRNMRKHTFSDSYMVQDAANLFPFRRPRLMILIFQYTYFETSLMMAVLLFNLWQDVHPDLILKYNWIAYVEVAAGILVMILTSILLLPVYWLTMVVGSHCPSSVLKKAKKRKVTTVRDFEKVSMSLKKTSINVARTSMGLQKASMASVETASSTAEVPSKSGIPTHWADVKGTPEIIQAQLKAKDLEEEEEKPKGQVGALGMLVGAMLKTKKRELENLVSGETGGEEAPAAEEESGPDASTASTSSKKKPLLRRLSVPLITLPGSKEPQAQPSKIEKAEEIEPEPPVPMKPFAPAQRAPNTGMTKSALARSKSLNQGHKPLPELHDIQEVVTPVGEHSDSSFAKSMMRKSKSLQQLCQDDAPEAQTVGSGSDGAAPSLSRASMPMLKIIDKKQKAYLERERLNAEHMMQEYPIEDVNRAAVVSPADEHGDAPHEAVVHELKKTSSPRGDTSPTMGGPRSGISRSTLDHVAELVKLGDKQKHQRE